MAINSGWTVVYSADNVAFFEDTGEMTYSPDGLCSSSSDDENKYCKAVLGDKLDYRIGLLDWTSEMSAVTPSTPISTITCNIEKEDSVDSCNEDMLTCWFKDTTNPYSITALTSGDNFDKKIVDECSQILEIKFKQDGSSSYHFNTGEQKFETSSYTDSGYPIISTDPNTSASAKYVEGVEYNNYHKVKYRVRSGYTPTNCIVNNSQLVELYFPHLHGINDDEGRDVSVIKQGSFSGNTSLSAVTFGGDKLRTIEKGAFSGCTNLSFIDWYHHPCNSTCALSSIGEYAFANCTSLTNVILPETNIGSLAVSGRAFYNCTDLTSVTISNRVRAIAPNSFENDPLKKVIFNCEVIGGNWFNGNTSISSLTFNASANIGGGAFRGCSSLAKIEKSSVGVGITTNNYVFAECPLLEEIDLGATSNVGDYAFYNCTNLRKVTIRTRTTSATVVPVGTNAFTNTSSNITLYVPNDLVSVYKNDANWSSYFGSRINPII